MTVDRTLIGRLLLLLALAFFIWACLGSAGLSAPAWLVPGGLAAWVAAGLLG